MNECAIYDVLKIFTQNKISTNNFDIGNESGTFLKGNHRVKVTHLLGSFGSRIYFIMHVSDSFIFFYWPLFFPVMKRVINISESSIFYRCVRFPWIVHFRSSGTSQYFSIVKQILCRSHDA